MAAERGPGEALTKTSGDGGAPDASSKPPEGTSSAPQSAQEGTLSAPPGPKPVGSVSPVVRQEAQVGRI